MLVLNNIFQRISGQMAGQSHLNSPDFTHVQRCLSAEFYGFNGINEGVEPKRQEFSGQVSMNTNIDSVS